MPAMVHVPVRVHISPRVIGALVFGVVLLASAAILYISATKVVTATAVPAAQSVGGNVYLSPSAASAAAASGSASQPMFEMQIANDGTTYLQDARVDSVSGNDITVSIAWGSASFLWTIQTDSGTKFLDQNGNDESSANIVPGEYVTITGQIDQLSQSPAIVAQYIRQS